MDNSNALTEPITGKEKSAGKETLVQDDVAVQPKPNIRKPRLTDEIPNKKRKTRRGKSKRKYPYNGRNSMKTSSSVIKPEAPHNSNQFLLEDHGIIEELDENLKNADQFSHKTVSRTKDSCFSIDSEGEFYSSPDDEEQFLIKDFVDQYESLQAERLQAMTKTKLIQEYLMLETKVELLTKRLCCNNKRDKDNIDELNKEDLLKEVERLRMENENLKRENELLKTTANVCTNTDSEDSETDSSDSCSSTSTSSSNCSTEKGQTSPLIEYAKTNGHHEVEIV